MIMQTKTFITKQFKTGGSQAVRISAEIAYPPNTQLSVWREGERIIIEPANESLKNAANLFYQLSHYLIDSDCQRMEVEETQRQW